MPLYEYRCTECEHTFEIIQKFSDPDLTECPQCKSEVERLFSPPAIRFKGSGWYVNDYARKSSGSNGDSASSSESDSSSDGDKKQKSTSESSSSDSKKSSKSTSETTA